jgi:hypothetical protein
MSLISARLVTVLMLTSTSASAEVCLGGWLSCGFHAAFKEAFSGLGFPAPSLDHWELDQIGDRPGVRYVFSARLNDANYQAFSNNRAQFDASLSRFSDEATTGLCPYGKTASFVLSGGVVELAIALEAEWDNADPVPAGLPDTVVVRLEHCEAP